MEFDLEQLRRDWVAGISGKDFMAKVDACAAKLKLVPDDMRSGGVLLCEADPVDFSAAFFAAVSMRFPLVLANPRWRAHEWYELEKLVAPVFYFGSAGVSTSAASAVVTTSTGSGTESSEAPTITARVHPQLDPSKLRLQSRRKRRAQGRKPG